MDKETEHRLTELETKIGGIESWNQFYKDLILKITSLLSMAGIMSAVLGWFLPDNIRKHLMDWMFK